MPHWNIDELLYIHLIIFHITYMKKIPSLVNFVGYTINTCSGFYLFIFFFLYKVTDKISVVFTRHMQQWPLRKIPLYAQFVLFVFYLFNKKWGRLQWRRLPELGEHGSLNTWRSLAHCKQRVDQPQLHFNQSSNRYFGSHLAKSNFGLQLV